MFCKIRISSYLVAFIYHNNVRGIIKKKREKSGQADCFGGGVTPLKPDRFYFVKILTHFVLYKMAK